MVKAPSAYDIRRRFLLALKPSISSAVIKLGITAEANDLEDIFRKAHATEQAEIYETWDETRGARLSIESQQKPKETRRAVPKGPTPSVSYKVKPNTTSAKPKHDKDKAVECFICKRKGHYSNKCPNRSTSGKAAKAHAEELSDNERDAEADAEESDQDSLATISEEESNQEEDSDSRLSSGQESELSLNNWGPRSCMTEIPTDNRYIKYDEPSHTTKRTLADLSSFEGLNDTDWDRTLMGQRTCPEITTKDNTQVIEIFHCAVVHLCKDDHKDIMESSRVTKPSQNEEKVAYRQRATKEIGPLRMADGPARDFKRLGVIEGYMRINGNLAHVLLDCGSTLDMIAANYAAVHKLDMFQLKKPIKLQMAMSGSHSVIQYRAWATLQVGKLMQTCYFDVVNLDRYNIILGTQGDP